MKITQSVLLLTTSHSNPLFLHLLNILFRYLNKFVYACVIILSTEAIPHIFVCHFLIITTLLANLSFFFKEINLYFPFIYLAFYNIIFFSMIYSFFIPLPRKVHFPKLSRTSVAIMGFCCYSSFLNLSSKIGIFIKNKFLFKLFVTTQCHVAVKLSLALIKLPSTKDLLD